MTPKEQLERYSSNVRWFLENLDTLRSLYPNRYVAVYGQQVIDSDPNLAQLEARLRKQGADLLAVSVIEYVGAKQPCLLVTA